MENLNNVETVVEATTDVVEAVSDVAEATSKIKVNLAACGKWGAIALVGGLALKGLDDLTGKHVQKGLKKSVSGIKNLFHKGKKGESEEPVEDLPELD